MMLLTLNGGIGNTDLALLPWSAINLETGWLVRVARLAHSPGAPLAGDRGGAAGGPQGAPADRDLVFPWGDRKKTFWWRYKKLMKLAGLNGGLAQMLRRSSATAVEAALPGGAMNHLGHKTHGLSYKHYVNPSELPFTRPMPPALPERKDGAA